MCRQPQYKNDGTVASTKHCVATTRSDTAAVTIDTDAALGAYRQLRGCP
jgi:CO/xanthine dehydrogenase FAD-binding subunit